MEHRPGRKGPPGRFGVPQVVFTTEPAPWLDEVQIEWTHDGSHLVTWSFGWLHGPSPTTVQIWTREGKLVWTGPYARQVDVHPTRLAIAAVVEDEVLLGWPGKELRHIALEGAFDAVEFSPDGARLAVGGRGFHVWVLDAANGDIVAARAVTDADGGWGMHEWIMRVRWYPDGRSIGLVAGKGLNPAVVRADDLSTIWAGGLFGVQMWRVYDVAWTPGGELLTGFGKVVAINVKSRSSRVIVEDRELVTSLPVGDDGEMLMVTGGRVGFGGLTGGDVRRAR